MTKQTNVTTKAAITLATKASEIAEVIEFNDQGMIARSLEYSSAVKKSGTALATFCAYLQATGYEPEYFLAPKDSAEDEVILKPSFFDPIDGKDVNTTLLINRAEVFEGLKAASVQTFLSADERSLMARPVKGMNDDNKAERKIAQQRVGAYMAMVRKALEKAMYPERSKAGKTETRKPLKRLKDDVAALAAFVGKLNPEMADFPDTLNITRLAVALKAAEDCIAEAWLEKAAQNKASTE